MIIISYGTAYNKTFPSRFDLAFGIYLYAAVLQYISVNHYTESQCTYLVKKKPYGSLWCHFVFPRETRTCLFVILWHASLNIGIWFCNQHHWFLEAKGHTHTHIYLYIYIYIYMCVCRQTGPWQLQIIVCCLSDNKPTSDVISVSCCMEP